MTHEYGIEAEKNEPIKLTCTFKVDLAEFKEYSDINIIFVGRTGMQDFTKKSEDFMLIKIYNELKEYFEGGK